MTPELLPAERWGFCAECERWLLSERWEPAHADGYHCPSCRAITTTVESGEGSIRRLRLFLVTAQGNPRGAEARGHRDGPSHTAGVLGQCQILLQLITALLLRLATYGAAAYISGTGTGSS